MSEFDNINDSVISTDGKILHYKLYYSKVSSDRTFDVQSHDIDTGKHKTAIKQNQNQNKFKSQKTQ